MPDSSTKTRAGLFTTGDTTAPVPMTGVSIDAEIRSFYAKVVVAHRYVNREATPIEAVYVFPLDEGAAVCGFEAIVDGTLVIGEVHEREEAFEIYDDAMEQGHGAFLLDEERPDVFQASVGNLPPGKDVLVKLTYVAELAIEDGRLRFTIPTTVSPRYAPSEDRTGPGRPDSEALNPPVAWTVPHGLNLSVHLTLPGAISRVESPSHPIALTLNERDATVALAQEDAALDRDFVLSIDAATLDAPQALVDRDADGTEAIGVAFAPRFEAKTSTAEVIFLVDRSGSMGGSSIEEVRNALQLCLRSMIPGCRFNIVGFGSTHETLFSESRAYDQASMTAASEHVAAMDANLGGTELLPPLKAILEQKSGPGLPRQVVVLTDGEITNTDAVMALASSHAADARIFMFGIGAGASHHLVRGLARAGGGTAEFIYPGERIEPKVLRQFARLLSPALTDVRVEWIGGRVTQSPGNVPPVFAGGRLMIYGFVNGTRPTSARLSATSPSGPLSFDVPLASLAAGSDRTVATLAARARIRELEEGGEWLASRGSQQKGRKETGVKKEIIALSIKYGLMSRETSFVAIERRETPVVGDVKLRKMPIALTTGWGGLHHTMPGPQMIMRLAAPSLAASAYDIGAVSCERRDVQVRDTDSMFFDTTPQFRRTKLGRDVVRAQMQALIRLQSADGTWELTSELASILGHTMDELKSRLDGAYGAPDLVARAWATALALVWLMRNAAHAEDEWRMLAAKGEQWLKTTTALAPGGRTWLDDARDFLPPVS